MKEILIKKYAIHKAWLSLLLLLVFASTAQAETVWYTYSSGLGADGYDLVSYFDADAPQEGKRQYSTNYGGATWRFSSKANLTKFRANPDKYTPEYGGHCAYAAAKNALAYGDPEQWTIHQGKLYFNYSRRVRRNWESKVSDYIAKGDKNWPGLVAKETDKADKQAQQEP